ncbi:MAG: 16S rRNA (cytosine(1402)-N(4))-methyltransferase RsmH [Chthoniobacteraceae bacterium]
MKSAGKIENQGKILPEVEAPSATPHKRRVRYAGKNPRRFSEKYKELNPESYPETVGKVLASGKTVAGTHRPIMVAEILEALDPKPGEIAVDCTLGFGGHAKEVLARVTPGGRLIGLDADPLELPRTEKRMRTLGFAPESFTALRQNFAGLPRALAEAGAPGGADVILADLGVSSMQLDRPERGFSVKLEGPLDMRMNPARGLSATQLLERSKPDELAELLMENSGEPHAAALGCLLAARRFETTVQLSAAVRCALSSRPAEEATLSVRRVFQALRIAVNDEFGALDMLLRQLPACLRPSGRVAILTFHSGEDRRVKHAFAEGVRSGVYAEVSREVTRAGADERHANPRSLSAKLRWVRRAA